VLACPLIALIVPLLPAAARAGDETLNVRAEVGAEYDSNVHRVERPQAGADPAVASALARAVFGWSASDRLGERHDVAFSVLGASKVFLAPEARSENVAIVETGGSWRVDLGGRKRLALGTSYYEALQAGTAAERAISGEARDFRSLTPSLGLSMGMGDGGALTVGGGYRWFVYKPLRSYDFGAPLLSLLYRWGKETADGTAEWEIAVGGAVELRRFAGSRFVPGPAGCDPRQCVPVAEPPPTHRHVDQFSTGHIDVARTGRLLLGLGYAAQWNRSNSYAESLLRHVLTVRLTTPLVLGIYLAARAELVYAIYPDPVALALGPSGRPSNTFDEEARSQVRGELSRDLGGHLQLVARASFYFNTLNDDQGGGSADYRRLTTTLSVAYNR
jgi:hypothetical protein